MTTPEDVLMFWFAGKPSDATMSAHEGRWFVADAAFDEAVRTRFGIAIGLAAAGELDGWAASAEGRLALIIVLDQFPRNAFRGRAAAYDLDRRAARLCLEGVEVGHDRVLAPIERIFFYLPLLHSERLSEQEQGVALLRRLKAEIVGRDTWIGPWLRLARRHRRIIARFGRFPHRNAILHRETTARERLFLLYHKLRSLLGRTIVARQGADN